MSGHIVINRGLPGSGKTTSFVPDRDDKIRVSRDALRKSLFDWHKADGVMNHARETFISKVQDSIVADALRRGATVVIDDMNLRPKYVSKWIKAAAKYGATWEVQEFPIPLETCVSRDRERVWTERVGESVIRRLAAKYMPGGEFLPYKVPETLQPGVAERYTPPGGWFDSAIMVDLDGTLAHMAGRGPYDYDLVGTDRVDPIIAELVTHYWNKGMEVIFCSGRPETCREATEKWLKDHLPFVEGKLLMRGADDGRPDFIVKRELFDKHIRREYNVLFVLDDRQQVVDMWRDLGLKCLQVAPGDF